MKISGEIERLADVPDLTLATCSYNEFHPDMGVPVATSIGKHPAFEHAVDCNSLKPWSTFRKMSDAPLEAQIARYQEQLSRDERRVARTLLDMQQSYPGTTLVLLCWCFLPKVGARGCHRRWAAEWITTRAGIDVPEYGRTSLDTPTRGSGSPSLF